MSETTPTNSNLPTPNRYTTTHDPATGLSIFSPALPTALAPYGSIGMNASPSTPSKPSDGVWFPATNETLLRYCDWAPGSTLAFHRTETIDLGVVFQGEMELTLDSGEKRILRVGDTVVQRGTLHAWRNPSRDTWARVVFFLLGAPPVRVGGEEKGERLPWREGS
ncbi:hypothetical protein B0T17DRAFT_620653 [Bombardia bombarda]|uniref:Cupin type-2 domain-containing protein n=1 Tax=Bombardia bombarda TaxID=252184 RepID=A0AA39TIA8_9PEZI|nr:hypothetical protein B0T17DRAFT_620653 [Bombardia bombarda]